MAISILTGVAGFSQQNETTEIDRIPIRHLVSNEGIIQQSGQSPVIFVENFTLLNAIKLGDDHAREGDLAQQRVAVILRLCFHIQLVTADDPG